MCAHVVDLVGSDLIVAAVGQEPFEMFADDGGQVMLFLELGISTGCGATESRVSCNIVFVVGAISGKRHANVSRYDGSCWCSSFCSAFWTANGP